MAITVNLYYTGQGTSARDFAREMLESGTVAKIWAEKGNLKYDYFFPMDDENTVLLIDIITYQNYLNELTYILFLKICSEIPGAEYVTMLTMKY